MISVELDEVVAADVLALLTIVSGWGDEWEPFLGRAGEAIDAFRDVLRADVALDASARASAIALDLAEETR